MNINNLILLKCILSLLASSARPEAAPNPEVSPEPVGSQQVTASDYRRRKTEGLEELGSSSSLPRKDNSVKRSFKDGGGQPTKDEVGSGQPTKSILDFLGIFDTRKFFYIPSERRAGEEEEREGEGILDSISRWWTGTKKSAQELSNFATADLQSAVRRRDFSV